LAVELLDAGLESGDAVGGLVGEGVEVAA